MLVWNINIAFETGPSYEKVVTAKEIVAFIKEQRKENKNKVTHKLLPVSVWLVDFMFESAKSTFPKLAITKSTIHKSG